MTDDTRFKRTPRHVSRLLLLGSTLVAFLLLAGACSSDSSSNDTTPTDDIVLDDRPSDANASSFGIDVAKPDWKK